MQPKNLCPASSRDEEEVQRAGQIPCEEWVLLAIWAKKKGLI